MKRKLKKRNKNGLVFARIRWLFLWFAVCIFHFFYQSYLTLYLFVIVTILPFLSFLMMRIYASSFHIRIAFEQKEIVQRMSSHLSIEVVGKHTPFGVVKLDYQIENQFYESKKTYVSSLLCAPKQKVKKVITLPYCGCYKAEITQVLLFDLLGLWKKRCLINGESTLFVLPIYQENTSITKTMEDGLEKEKETWNKTGLLSNDSYEIREYQEGDSLKYLHHKMSYKLNKPMVRQFASLQQAHMLMVLDLQGDIDTVEQTLQTFYSIAKTMLAHGVLIKCGYIKGKQTIVKDVVTTTMLTQVLKEILQSPRSKHNHTFHSKEDIVYCIHGGDCQRVKDQEGAYA